MHFYTKVKLIVPKSNPIRNRHLHNVRVRFAPSPTGYLHLGGLRTALYNYFFAKKNNGKFILRIEDTDQTRTVGDATQSLMKDIHWAGIVIDEGPIVGGKFGPYIQSQRTNIYNDAVRILLENKTAYRCFCTETRLNMLQREAQKLRQVPGYDNKCRHMTLAELTETLKMGKPFCIRFKMDKYSDNVTDLIYGDVLNSGMDNEGDPVIIKSDGFPTYHFASVVDDHMMKITHVFRGVEWLVSTIKHLQLYRAFGWTPPKYGHLPLLINANGTKFSKRQGDSNIKYFRDCGIFPLALVNYVMSAGGGFRHEQSRKPEIQSFEALWSMFDIERVNSHPNRLNPSLLKEFNNLEIMRKLSDTSEKTQLVNTVRNMILSKYPEKNANDLTAQHISNVLTWSMNRLTTLSDLTSEKLNFLWTDGTVIYTNDLTKDQIMDLITILEGIGFTKNNIFDALKNYSLNIPIKFNVLMKTLRIALSGLKEGPGVAEVMEIFGKEDSLRRIKRNLRSKNKRACRGG